MKIGMFVLSYTVLTFFVYDYRDCLHHLMQTEPNIYTDVQRQLTQTVLLNYLIDELMNPLGKVIIQVSSLQRNAGSCMAGLEHGCSSPRSVCKRPYIQICSDKESEQFWEIIFQSAGTFSQPILKSMIMNKIA